MIFTSHYAIINGQYLFLLLPFLVRSKNLFFYFNVFLTFNNLNTFFFLKLFQTGLSAVEWLDLSLAAKPPLLTILKVLLNSHSSQCLIAPCLISFFTASFLMPQFSVLPSRSRRQLSQYQPYYCIFSIKRFILLLLIVWTKFPSLTSVVQVTELWWDNLIQQLSDTGPRSESNMLMLRRRMVIFDRP